MQAKRSAPPSKQADSRTLVRTKEPGIYKRGSAYVVRFRVHGKERKRFARTLAEARAIRATAKADASRGEWREVSKLTFAEYAAQWLDGYTGRTSRGVRPTTLDEYRRLVNDQERGAIACFRLTKLAAISPPDIKGYARALAEAGLSASTIRNYLTPVKAMLADAFEDGLIRVNPAARVRIATPVELDGSFRAG